MSTWCIVCGKTTFNEKLCDHCGEIPIKKAKEYQVPKNKGARISKGKAQTNNLYMTPCDICGNEIAVKATSCPHCGDTKSKNLFWKIVKIVAIVMAILFIIDVIITAIGLSIANNAVKDLNKQTTKMINNIPKFTIPKIKTQNYKSKWEIEQERKKIIEKNRIYQKKLRELNERNKRLREKNKLLNQMNN